MGLAQVPQNLPQRGTNDVEAEYQDLPGSTFNPIMYLMMLWNSQPVFTLKMYDQVAVYPLLVCHIMNFTDELLSPTDRKQLQRAPGEEGRNKSKPVFQNPTLKKAVPFQMVTQLTDHCYVLVSPMNAAFHRNMSLS